MLKNILTDEGNRFCSFKIENGKVLFIAKNGSLELYSLLFQVFGAEILQKRNDRSTKGNGIYKNESNNKGEDNEEA